MFEAVGLAIHQLTPVDIGEFTVVGVVTGNVEAGESVSGLELGFRNGGVVIVGMVGTKLGIVVMGVVISFWVVEIGAVNSNCFPSCPSSFTCLGASFSVLLEPVFEMTIEVSFTLFCSLSKACEDRNQIWI